jgi:hypothetical protein
MGVPVVGIRIERINKEKAIMTYTLTDEQKKALTLMMGECWHEPYNAGQLTWGGGYHNWFCSKCKKKIGADGWHRTFASDKDMLDLFRWLVDKGKWEQFYWLAFEYLLDTGDGETGFGDPFIAKELFLGDPKRACWLVSQAREKGVI